MAIFPRKLMDGLTFWGVRSQIGQQGIVLLLFLSQRTSRPTNKTLIIASEYATLDLDEVGR